jgi:hypothetical protein
MFEMVLSGPRAAVWLIFVLSVAVLPVVAQTAATQETADASAQYPETPEGELAPAAVQLDESTASPLIQTLYGATRETKDQATLDDLTHAKSLIEASADTKATDSLGRTALHWAVFGSSYATKAEVIVAYEEIADALIAHGVDINHQDTFNNTALDYLLYSPNFEMQTLLVEKSATSGYLAASFNYISQLDICKTPDNQNSTSRASANHVTPKPVSVNPAMTTKADLVPGQTMSIRLLSRVSSDGSRTGDPVDGVVTYPLCTYGEWMACKPGSLLVPPGTRVKGTVLFAKKAPDKYSRPLLVLTFSTITHKDGSASPLHGRVIDVDDARETIRNSEILGIVQPHVSGKVSLAFMAVGAATPFAGYAINGARAVYGLSIRREVLLPPGTDVQIQVVHPSRLKVKESWEGWPTLAPTAKLRALVVQAPLRTKTKNGTSSDLTNLMFLGSRQEIESAFDEAGWFEAVPSAFGSNMKVVQATLRKTGYSEAPVSTLLIDGRKPDLVFQKSLDTFAKRHHIRIWKLASTYEGREVWVGAATHDIATEHNKTMTQWTHRIDSHIDRERDWIESDLLFIGSATGYVDVDRPKAPRTLANATGDNITTDGIMSVVQVGPARTKPAGDPQLTSR